MAWIETKQCLLNSISSSEQRPNKTSSAQVLHQIGFNQSLVEIQWARLTCDEKQTQVDAWEHKRILKTEQSYSHLWVTRAETETLQETLQTRFLIRKRASSALKENISQNPFPHLENQITLQDKHVHKSNFSYNISVLARRLLIVAFLHMIKHTPALAKSFSRIPWNIVSACRQNASRSERQWTLEFFAQNCRSLDPGDSPEPS